MSAHAQDLRALSDEDLLAQIPEMDPAVKEEVIKRLKEKANLIQGLEELEEKLRSLRENGCLPTEFVTKPNALEAATNYTHVESENIMRYTNA